MQFLAEFYLRSKLFFALKLKPVEWFIASRPPVSSRLKLTICDNDFYSMISYNVSQLKEEGAHIHNTARNYEHRTCVFDSKTFYLNSWKKHHAIKIHFLYFIRHVFVPFAIFLASQSGSNKKCTFSNNALSDKSLIFLKKRSTECMQIAFATVTTFSR